MSRPSNTLELLLPRPRRAEAAGGPWRPGDETTVRADGDGPLAERAAARAVEALRAAGIAARRDDGTAGAAAVRLRVAAGAGLPPEGYRLRVGAAGVEAEAADSPGLSHAVSTLLQWLESATVPDPGGTAVPALEVEDSPDLRERGVMLDVARDKVPRMDTLFALVDRLAGWKVNQLQLYTEHSFAYRGHEVVWRDADPLTPDEVGELDRFCRLRGVELVPNQNSFGHFHRWLVHDAYRPLAECPEGIDHPFSLVPEPFSLCAVDPGSLALLADLYDQLLPCFESPRFNVGLDESFDLGRCRSAAACAARGRHRVYLDYLRAVHRLVGERGRRMMFWGDIVHEEPAIVPELPGDAIALEWGYEAGHAWEERLARFADAGLDLYVCPGTSSWASLTGRTTNAVDNCAEAAGAARAAGALGYLLTDWGDYGHLQPLPVSWPGFAAGAAAAWNADAPLAREALPRVLDARVFRDPAAAAGRAVAELGDTYLVAGGNNLNGTALFYLLLKPERRMDEYRSKTLTREGLAAALDHLERVAGLAAVARVAEPEPGRTAAEIGWAADAAAFACRLGIARLDAGRGTPVESLPPADRARLAAELAALVARRSALWLARNRPGGLEHALGFLAPLARRLG